MGWIGSFLSGRSQKSVFKSKHSSSAVVLLGILQGSVLDPVLFIVYINYILTHQIRISDILSWDRKFHLTHVILARLSGEGCTLVVLELAWWSSDVIVILTSSCHIASQRRSPLQT